MRGGGLTRGKGLREGPQGGRGEGLGVQRRVQGGLQEGEGDRAKVLNVRNEPMRESTGRGGPYPPSPSLAGQARGRAGAAMRRGVSAELAGALPEAVEHEVPLLDPVLVAHLGLGAGGVERGELGPPGPEVLELVDGRQYARAEGLVLRALPSGGPRQSSPSSALRLCQPLTGRRRTRPCTSRPWSGARSGPRSRRARPRRSPAPSPRSRG